MDDRRIVLLGAGASAEAGIPTAMEMTHKMIEHFEKENILEELKILKFVVGGLLFKAGIHGESPMKGVNIEEVFEATELLSNRNSLGIFPFVGHWHPFIEELERNKPNLMDRLWNQRTISSERDLKKILSTIEKTMQEALRSPTGEIFKRTAQYMLVILCKLVWIEDMEEVRYLLPLVNYAYNNRTTVVSLNYDNVIELFEGFNGMSINTGLQIWNETGTFQKPDSGIELIKLHGSIDWEIKTMRNHYSFVFPQTLLKKINNEEMSRLKHSFAKSNRASNYTPGIVFGTGNKLRADGPFLELFRTFKNRLEESEELISVGYSFRDEHVNELIRSWLNRRENRKTTIITREDAKSVPNNDWVRLSHKSPERCEVMDVGAKEGISTLFG